MSEEPYNSIEEGIGKVVSKTSYIHLLASQIISQYYQGNNEQDERRISFFEDLLINGRADFSFVTESLKRVLINLGLSENYVKSNISQKMQQIGNLRNKFAHEIPLFNIENKTHNLRNRKKYPYRGEGLEFKNEFDKFMQLYNEIATELETIIKDRNITKVWGFPNHYKPPTTISHQHMKKKIFLGTNNQGKIERFKNLIVSAGLDIEIYTPGDFGLEKIEVKESGKTLAENAEIKARAYFGKVDIPIITNDTGFWVEGEGLVEAPKRKALGETDERNLTKIEIASALLEFWKSIARKHGGKVDAAWIEAFALLDPDGQLHTSESRREVILTDQEFGEAHIQMPVRALYISKTTNKPAIQHTKEEEFLELKPVTDALIKIITE